LGREGSDYSAAIFAYAINAESLTIWKDVEGLLNGDPKYFKNTKLIKNISYSEAIELAFYGASVIHPKTLQPVQKKEIPLYVKSFEKPNQKGTEINKNLDLSPKVPCYIFKNNMIFIKIFSLDFSFAIDKNLSHIFKKIDEFKMKVDIIQNSAISFSICLFDKYNQIDNLIKSLEGKFKIEVYKNISLYTIRHFDEQAIKVVSKGKKLLLEQRSEKTVKLIFKN
jgi:aspartate kinase